LLAFVLWGSIVGIYIWYQQANNLSVEDIAQQLGALLTSRWGIFIFIVAYLIRPLIFFPATVLTILGGAIFGPILGTFLTIIAANSGAMIAYMVGRFFGDNIIDEKHETGLLQKYGSRMRESSFNTVFIMRLIFLPYDLVNYMSGFLKIDWKSFLLATILGSIPGTVSFTLFGSSIDLSQGLGNVEFNPWAFGGAFTIFLASLGISRLVKSRETGQKITG
ncbi:MAG: putative membrane protein YdjX (TVP38/TMEM64 family), partial [Candidatus Promineifilaceae bacterium]